MAGTQQLSPGTIIAILSISELFEKLFTLLQIPNIERTALQNKVLAMFDVMETTATTKQKEELLSQDRYAGDLERSLHQTFRINPDLAAQIPAIMQQRQQTIAAAFPLDTFLGIEQFLVLKIFLERLINMLQDPTRDLIWQSISAPFEDATVNRKLLMEAGPAKRDLLEPPEIRDDLADIAGEIIKKIRTGSVSSEEQVKANAVKSFAELRVVIMDIADSVGKALEFIEIKAADARKNMESYMYDSIFDIYEASGTSKNFKDNELKLIRTKFINWCDGTIPSEELVKFLSSKLNELNQECKLKQTKKTNLLNEMRTFHGKIKNELNKYDSTHQEAERKIYANIQQQCKTALAIQEGHHNSLIKTSAGLADFITTISEKYPQTMLADNLLNNLEDCVANLRVSNALIAVLIAANKPLIDNIIFAPANAPVLENLRQDIGVLLTRNVIKQTLLNSDNIDLLIPAMFALSYANVISDMHTNILPEPYIAAYLRQRGITETDLPNKIPELKKQLLKIVKEVTSLLGYKLQISYELALAQFTKFHQNVYGSSAERAKAEFERIFPDFAKDAAVFSAKSADGTTPSSANTVATSATTTSATPQNTQQESNKKPRWVPPSL